MSIENELGNLIKDAARKVEQKQRAKPQPLDGGYRGTIWYKHIFSKIGPDEAYDLVVKNIKTKTFSYEPEIAVKTYEEVYGIKFQSKEEKAVAVLKDEASRLKAEVEALKAQKVSLGAEPEPQTKEPENVENSFSTIPGLTQDQFKEAYYAWYVKKNGRKPTGGEYMKAWRQYENPGVDNV